MLAGFRLTLVSRSTTSSPWISRALDQDVSATFSTAALFWHMVL